MRTCRSAEEAGDIIWALTSPEVHRLYRDDLGWTPDQYRTWLTDTLIRTLL